MLFCFIQTFVFVKYVKDAQRLFTENNKSSINIQARPWCVLFLSLLGVKDFCSIYDRSGVVI